MSRTRVLIDCDPGVDDAIALLLALASPELDVLAVTTVAGNVPWERTFDNGRRVVALAGRPEVPVHRGCTGPLLGPVLRGKYSGDRCRRCAPTGRCRRRW